MKHSNFTARRSRRAYFDFDLRGELFVCGSGGFMVNESVAAADHQRKITTSLLQALWAETGSSLWNFVYT